MSTHRIPDQRVHPKGIRIPLSQFITILTPMSTPAPLLGQRVTAFVDYDNPEVYSHREPPCQYWPLKVGAGHFHGTTPPAEEIAKSNSARRAHVSGALGQSGIVQNPLAAYFIRDHDHNTKDIDTGRRIGEATRQSEAGKD